MHILIQYKLLELRLSNGLFLIICFAIIQGLFEIVLHRFHTGDSKSKLFKMMAIRTAKFLLYLIISLIFLIYNTEQQRAISLVIIVYFQFTQYLNYYLLPNTPIIASLKHTRRIFI